MNFPEELKYTNEHEWVKSVGGDTYLVGITDFAQSELGDIIFIEFKSVGSKIKKGDSFGTIEAVKTVAELYMPYDGEILEINPRIADEAFLANSSPYQDGWLVKIKATENATLLSVKEYRALIGK